jgi:UDP-N-acetylmuramoyl-tripeptide--D-alanyl-D-alanine ligase
MIFLIIPLAIFLLINTYKYLALIQREHYIAGSCTKFRARWMMSFPFISPMLTKSMIPKFTPRFLRLTLISAFIMLPGIFINPLIFLILFSIFTYLLIDLSALIARPIENIFAEKFVTRATNRLKKVEPVVVGITGSYGKTSTKQHLKELLNGVRQTVATPASWNNKAGISRSINEYLEDGTEIFIAEMGMYKRGEIAQLCEWVNPQISVITAIGNSHLERIGSVENIVKAKSEILKTAEKIVLWVSDPRLETLSKTIKDREMIRVGFEGMENLLISVKEDDETYILLDPKKNEIGRVSKNSELHISNIACSLGVYYALGLPLINLKDKISNLSTPQHRATIGTAKKGYSVMDNTFNSNLEGAKSNILKLKSVVNEGRMFVVTPGIVELGKEQDVINYELGKAIALSGAQLLVTHRTNRKPLIRGALDNGGAVEIFSNRVKAVDWVRNNLNANDGVLYENDLPLYYP